MRNFTAICLLALACSVLIGLLTLGCVPNGAAQARARFAIDAQVNESQVTCVESPKPGAWFCSFKESKR